MNLVKPYKTQFDLNSICKPIFLEMEATMDKEILMNEFNVEPLDTLKIFDSIRDSIFELNMVKFAGKY